MLKNNAPKTDLILCLTILSTGFVGQSVLFW